MYKSIQFPKVSKNFHNKTSDFNKGDNFLGHFVQEMVQCRLLPSSKTPTCAKTISITAGACNNEDKGIFSDATMCQFIDIPMDTCHQYCVHMPTQLPSVLVTLTSSCHILFPATNQLWLRSKNAHKLAVIRHFHHSNASERVVLQNSHELFSTNKTIRSFYYIYIYQGVSLKCKCEKILKPRG